MIDSKTELGISVINPVDIDPDFLELMIGEAIKGGIKHIQVNGPMHHRKHANIDGSIYYKKYSQYNENKDHAYIKRLEDGLPSVLKKAKDNGIKVYFWHHELEIPDGFIEHYPEILNETGDIEASSPALEDFLRNKIRDFFELFPDFAGLVMTLHETVVPLLKLPNQKLSKKERIKHVCGIIIEECKNFGKKVIFRPFASLPEDCRAMSEAFNLLGEDIEIMTKWTQFDWNLHLPWNESSRDLSNHPLWVEGDINGEYFGQGRIPCILKKHTKDRISRFANEPYTIKGFVLRTDRNLNSLYNGINEVNIHLAGALIKNQKLDVDVFLEQFVNENYNGYESIKRLFYRSQELVEKTLYVQGYYFSAGSYLPDMFAVKNHYYFDLINGIPGEKIDSEEWFVPKNFRIPPYKDILKEKDEVLDELIEIKADFLEEDEEKNLLSKEKKALVLNRLDNFIYLVETWTSLIKLIRAYGQSIKTSDRGLFYAALEEFSAAGAKQDPYQEESYLFRPDTVHSPVTTDIFAKQIKDNFEIEFTLRTDLQAQCLIDYILLSSCLEGHALRKEINFSDNEIIERQFVRYLGKKGKREEGVNILIGAYGWLEYELHNPDSNAKKLEITFYTGGHAAKAEIFFRGSATQTVIYENPTPQAFDQFILPFIEKAPEKIQIRIAKLSKEPLGISVIKLC